MQQALKKIKKLFFILLVPITFISCSEVRLIGAYNQNVDQSLQNISKDISTLFVQIEKNMDDGIDWSYTVFRESYIKIESQISSCKIVANGIPKYNIIVKQIDLLAQSINALEADHRAGFGNADMTTAQRKKAVEVDQTGIETSLKDIFKLQEGLKRE